MADLYDTSALMKMHRSKWDMPVKHKTSIPFGKLVPIGGAPVDVLPGDTFRLDLAAVIRMMTPKAPLMDDISGDIYAFFVPWRIVWNKAKNFFGENDLVAWTLDESVTIPKIKLVIPSSYVVGTGDTNVFVSSSDGDILSSKLSGTLLDYFGLPFANPTYSLASTIKTFETNNSNAPFIELNALYFRGYQLIYNEFFRKDAIIDPRLDFAYDNNDLSIDLSVLAYNRAKMKLSKVARWNDLYSSCLPAPQRHDPIGILPSGANAKLKAGTLYDLGGTLRLQLSNNHATGGTVTSFLNLGLSPSSSSSATKDWFLRPQSTLNTDNPDLGDYINGINLYADLASATTATVNSLRIAFATQRYYEALARTSPRYVSYTETFFGTRAYDATLQRPQFLGGHHFNISIAQVTSMSETTNANLGSTGAVSVTGVRDNIFVNSFAEHGFIMTFVVLRKEHTYCQGVDKEWTKTDLWDIYNPKFAMIGEVPVATNEVFWEPGQTSTLGYNSAWYEYKSRPAISTGLLDPKHPQSLSYFTLTDVLGVPPTLNADFVEEDPNGLDRALIAHADDADQFFGDFRLDYKVTRVMPLKSVPGLMDHF